MKLGCGHEGFDTFCSKYVAEMRIAEFALEHAPLLFLDAPSRFEGNSNDPFEISIGEGNARVRREQLGEAAHRFAHGFYIAAGKRSPEMNTAIQHICSGRSPDPRPTFP